MSVLNGVLCKFYSAAIIRVPQIVTYEKKTGHKALEDTIVLIVAATGAADMGRQGRQMPTQLCRGNAQLANCKGRVREASSLVG